MNALEAVLSSAEISDETPPESAQQAFIEAYNTKGSALDLTSSADIQTIFNSADSIANSGGLDNLITQMSSVISEANTQINNNRTDFFSDAGRATGLVAQDSVMAGIDEVLSDPSDAAVNFFRLTLTHLVLLLNLKNLFHLLMLQLVKVLVSFQQLTGWKWKKILKSALIMSFQTIII